MSHTPGPWKVWDREIVPDFCVADVAGISVVPEDEAAHWQGNYEDDARLIAAAPDLLAACEAALERLEVKCQCDTEDCAWHRVRIQLRTAIAKARGEGITMVMVPIEEEKNRALMALETVLWMRLYGYERESARRVFDQIVGGRDPREALEEENKRIKGWS